MEKGYFKIKESENRNGKNAKIDNKDLISILKI